MAGLLELTVNPLLNSVGGQPHNLRVGFARRLAFADLESPYPQIRLNLHKGKFNALAVHDFDSGGKDGVFGFHFCQ